MAKFDTAELLDTMKRRGYVPTSQGTYSVADLLADASLELETSIHPLIVQANSEQGVISKDTTLVQGTRRYRLPPRAAAVRQVMLKQTDGRYRPLDLFDGDDLARYRLDDGRIGEPTFYWVEGDSLYLWPTPSTAHALRVKYWPTPNRLVQQTAVGIVASKPSATTLTMTSDVSGLTNGTVCDLVRATPGFEHLDIDITLSTKTGSGPYTLTFAAAYNPDVEVGDQVCLAREAAVPQVPSAFHLPLALRAIAPALRGIGNKKLADDLVAEAKDQEQRAVALICPRNKATARDISDQIWFR